MGGPAARGLLSVTDARAVLAATGQPVDRTERLALADAAGRVLAAKVVAAVDVPPFARSAMDGYAVRAADTVSATTDRPVRLRVVDRAYAGRPARRGIESGTAIAVATGAVVPDDADAVVMVEDTRVEGDEVLVVQPGATGRHITPRASDVRTGEIVLKAGDLVTPARAGVMAALGLEHAEVYARPRVAILSTGDEVVPPGRPLARGEIYDVNSVTLAALVSAHGGEPVVHTHVGDDPVVLDRAFAACLDADLVLVSGGSSVGERDFVLETIRASGTVLFEGIAIKPGKPTILGIVRNRPVFGMSGNPTSCLSNGYLFVVPLLRRLARLPLLEPRRVAASLAASVTSPAERHQFYTVRLDGDRAVPSFKGSGEITSMAGADGYFEIPAGCDRVEAGSSVEVTMF